jgi:hypothetical protein
MGAVDKKNSVGNGELYRRASSRILGAICIPPFPYLVER